MSIQTWVGASPATRSVEQALRALRAGFDGVVLEPLARPGERLDPRFGRSRGRPQLPKSGEHPPHRLRELKELALRYPDRARIQAVWGGASFQLEHALLPWLDHLTGWELWPTAAELASPRALTQLLKRACLPGLLRPWVRLPLNAAGELTEGWWRPLIAEYGARVVLDLEGEGLSWAPPHLDLTKLSSYAGEGVVLRGGIWTQSQLLGLDISQLRALELVVPILNAGFAGALHGFKNAEPQVVGSPRPKPCLGARPRIIPARCTSCGACITGCEDSGSQCLHQTAILGAPVVDVGRCNGCGLCAWLCSSGALQMVRGS